MSSIISSLVAPFSVLVCHRVLLFKTVLSEIREKNAGMALGNWWFLISPVFFLSIYCVVYLVIFRVRPSGMERTEYILYIFCGLVPFLSMSEALSLGVNALGANKTLVRASRFPIEILPVKAVLGVLPTFAVGMLVVLLSAWFLSIVTSALLALPFIIVLQVMFLVGLTWVLSLINLVLRDIRYLVSYAITVAMVLSPIAYTLEMVPDRLRPLLWLNPFAYFIISYQFIIVKGALPPSDILGLLVACSLTVFIFGYFLFVRLKMIFTNYV